MEQSNKVIDHFIFKKQYKNALDLIDIINWKVKTDFNDY